MSDSLNNYSLLNDDDKYEALSLIIEGVKVLDDKLFKFLIEDLDNHYNHDEFLIARIIKILVRFSDDKFTPELRDKIFKVFLESNEDLVRQHAILELEFVNLSNEQYSQLENALSDTDDEDLAAILRKKLKDK